jgi:hypothetical protein
MGAGEDKYYQRSLLAAARSPLFAARWGQSPADADGTDVGTIGRVCFYSQRERVLCAKQSGTSMSLVFEPDLITSSVACGFIPTT